MPKLSPIIVWNITTNCYYRCLHCFRFDYRNFQEPSLNQLLEQADKLAELDPRAICLSGGEPLLRSDLDRLLQHLSDLGLRASIELRSAKLTHRTAELLERYQVHVCIALEGATSQITDKLHGFQGAHKLVLSNLELCRELGLSFGLNSTITKFNYHELPSISELACRTGATTHHMNALIPLGRASSNFRELSLSSMELQEFFKLAHQTESKCSKLASGRFDFVVYEPCYMVYLLKLGEEIPEWVSRYGKLCRIGTPYTFWTIDPDGSLLPCPRAARNLSLGNVFSQSPDEIAQSFEKYRYLQDPTNLDEPCRSCRFNHICVGCRMRAYVLTGKLEAADPCCAYASAELAA